MLKKIYWFLFVYDLNDPFVVVQVADGTSLQKKLVRDTTCLVLFSYILFIFNSAIPVFADIVAHTFWEKQHVLTVHKENGKYHVHLQLLNDEKQAAKDKNPGNSKGGSEDFTHVVSVSTYAFSSNLFITQPYTTYRLNYSFLYPNSHYHPPTV